MRDVQQLYVSKFSWLRVCCYLDEETSLPPPPVVYCQFACLACFQLGLAINIAPCRPAVSHQFVCFQLVCELATCLRREWHLPNIVGFGFFDCFVHSVLAQTNCHCVGVGAWLIGGESDVPLAEVVEASDPIPAIPSPE